MFVGPEVGTDPLPLAFESSSWRNACGLPPEGVDALECFGGIRKAILTSIGRLDMVLNTTLNTTYHNSTQHSTSQAITTHHMLSQHTQHTTTHNNIQQQQQQQQQHNTNNNNNNNTQQQQHTATTTTTTTTTTGPPHQSSKTPQQRGTTNAPAHVHSCVCLTRLCSEKSKSGSVGRYDGRAKPTSSPLGAAPPPAHPGGRLLIKHFANR